MDPILLSKKIYVSCNTLNATKLQGELDELLKSLQEKYEGEEDYVDYDSEWKEEI